MIYLALILAVAAVMFISISPSFQSHRTARFFLVILFYTLAICFFMVYLCKDSLHLGTFLNYFPFPRPFVLWLYNLNISKNLLLRFINIACLLFIFGNVLFAITFLPTASNKGSNRLLAICGGYLLLQGLLYDPYLYRFAYSKLYPAWFSSTSIAFFFKRLSVVTNLLNGLLLAVCVAAVAYSAVQASKIKLFRLTTTSIALSYTLVVVSYLFFFYRLPTLMIKYSKVADTVTYQPLATGSTMAYYRHFPYVVFVFVLLFAVSFFRLTAVQLRLSNQNTEITRHINAANMSSRVICHYMKNQVLSISAELEELPVTTDTREAIENIFARCDHVYRKLDAIHQSVRDNALNQRQVRIDQVIQDAIEQTGHKLDGVTLESELPATVPFVLADPAYLGMALSNILCNACEAMESSEQRRLFIQVEQNLHWVSVSISDTGCGIAQKDLFNIFTPLFSSKPMTKNWGVGLTHSHRIITELGGKIEVKSRPGKGTTFEILLPCANPGHTI